MMNSDSLSICIVGAGSSYTPELIEGLIARSPQPLPVRTIRMTDVDADRLEIMAGLSERMIRHAGRSIEVMYDTRPEPMLEGADFVITQIRVGGMAARYLDESIPLKYGIIGQETTGPGGMCKALRTIPPMLEIADTVARICPQATILNYTNPSGIITEAVSKYSQARIIGLCSGIPSIQEHLHKQLSAQYPDLSTYTLGLNHFGFVHRFLSGGKDVTREAIEYLYAEAQQGENEGEKQLMALARLVGAVPISYVNYYFHRAKLVAEVSAFPATRGQRVARIEQEIFSEAALPTTVSKPQALAQRGGGGYADVTFAVMQAIVDDSGAELTANVPNRGAVDGIDDDAVVEILCRIDRQGATPLPAGPIPLAYRGLMQAIKAYETLTVEAAVKRDRNLALLALANHPLVGDLETAEKLLDEMLAAHGLVFL